MAKPVSQPRRQPVANPYAKKKKITSVAAPDTVTAIGYAPKRPHDQTHNPRGLCTSVPSPPPVTATTTFSQAFGDVDPDANFGEEERAQQAAFDQSLASNNPSNLNPRDNHTLLQPHSLHISTRQRGNPILAHIRNVPHQFSTMVPDYIFAPTRCALYLSLRYHNLHPNYIHRRIAELKSDFEYRMLLCHVDIDDNTSPLLFLNDLCVQNNFTLILAWSEEEAARYLETVKAFDGKDASILQKRDFTTHVDQVSHALGSVRSVNKTDSSQLLNQFGCWKNLAGASIEELSVCPGVGPKKVRRLWEAFHRPFSTEMKKRRKERETEKQSKDGKVVQDNTIANYE
ncbi:hypothetical protein ACHAWF_001930 [Thalassiosira exigua]